MPKKKIHFIGFLTNADASILQLGLNHGFKTEALPQSKAVNFIVAVDEVRHAEALKTLFIRFPCINKHEKQVYVVSNSFEADVKTQERDLFNVAAGFDNNFVHGYLNPRFRLMRLFKEGDLRMPLKYYYTIKSGKPSSFVSGMSGRYVSRESYHLESSELRDLHRFLRDTKIPFKRAFLQLAFENSSSLMTSQILVCRF